MVKKDKVRICITLDKIVFEALVKCSLGSNMTKSDFIERSLKHVLNFNYDVLVNK